MGIGKIELVEAESIAHKVLDHIKPALDRGEIAGSIRRQKPIVGDIEIVGISTDRDRLLKLLEDVGMHIKPGVPGAVPWTPKSTAKYLRVRLAEGMNLDLFMATPQNWGGLFLMRTGSGADLQGNPFNGFTPGIFGRWKKLSGGGRMTECMPTMPTGEQLWVPEEKDYFDLLEMNFVPPVERTSKNVIKKYVKSDT
jgi:DNA polymerase/3'-5' exonuclease PolX